MRRSVREGDWRTALLAAAAGVLAAFVVAALVSLTAALADLPRNDDGLVVTSDTWLRYVAATVGSTFWGPMVLETGSDGFFGGFASAAFAPLTATAASLAALYAVLRRAPRDRASTALAGAVRAAVPFATGVGVVALFGRYASPDLDGLTLRTSVPEAAFWAFVTATATGLVAYRDLWPPLPAELRARRDDWWLAARGAFAGLAAGYLLCAAVVLGHLVGYRERLGGWGNVGRALPALLGYLPNAAASLFSVASGGRYGLSAGPRAHVALYERHGLSPLYLLLLLVPAVAVTVAVRYVARRRGDRTERDVRALVVRAGFVAAGLWWLSEVAGRVRFAADVFDVPARAAVGASLFWGTLAVLAWFVAGGWLLARFAVARVPAGTVPKPPRPRREAATYVLVLALATAAVAVAGIGSVLAGG